MTIKNLVLRLRSEDKHRLTQIFLDEDQEESLLFLKECVKPQLESAIRDH
jgi:hypothetical protein